MDDFAISGGTLINLARRLKELGARRTIVCTSHLLLNEKGTQNIDESDVDLLVSTDSLYNPNASISAKVRIISAAPLFAEAILRIHNNKSISPLFNPPSDEVVPETI